MQDAYAQFEAGRRAGRHACMHSVRSSDMHAVRPPIRRVGRSAGRTPTLVGRREGRHACSKQSGSLRHAVSPSVRQSDRSVCRSHAHTGRIDRASTATDETACILGSQISQKPLRTHETIIAHAKCIKVCAFVICLNKMSDAYGVHLVYTFCGTKKDHPLTCILDATAPPAVKSAHRPHARAHAPHAHNYRLKLSTQCALLSQMVRQAGRAAAVRRWVAAALLCNPFKMYAKKSV